MLLTRLPGKVSVQWPQGERFAPAGVEHRFEDSSPDFAIRVVIWVPKGGEH